MPCGRSTTANRDRRLGLTDQDLYIEVIADSVHLHPKTLELIFNHKRLDKLIIVSDSVKGQRTAKA